MPVFFFNLFFGAAGLKVDWAEEDQMQDNIISVPLEVYTKGCVQDVDDGQAVSISNKSHHKEMLVSFLFFF